jgi:excinuclease ABC subunit B
MDAKELTKLIADVEKQMRKAAADLNFEAAAELRDRMVELKKHLLEVENSLTGGAGSDDSGKAVSGDASASKNAVNMHDAVRSTERSAKRGARRKSSGRTERRTGK